MGTAASDFEQQQCLVLSQKTMMTKLLLRRTHANIPCPAESVSWSRSPVSHMLERCHSRPLRRSEAWITPAWSVTRAKYRGAVAAHSAHRLAPATAPCKTPQNQCPSDDALGRRPEIAAGRAEPCLLYPQKRTSRKIRGRPVGRWRIGSIEPPRRQACATAS